MANPCDFMSIPGTATPEKDLTVGEHLDARIAAARLHLEKLCIAKAKAEATQMLNVPMDFIYTITF